MTSTRHKLGELITQYSERCGNRNVRHSDISGINRDKEFFPSKLVGENISNYKVVPFGYFACNLMHVGRDVVLPIAYNNSGHDVFVSPAYTVFSIKEDAPLVPRYLEMWFKSNERDRYFWMHTDSSIRDGMTFDDMCDVEIDLPPIEIQKKYVDIYNAMIANQTCYERGLEDLKLVYDGYMDNLKRNDERIRVGDVFDEIDRRNTNNAIEDVRGINIEKRFIPTVADTSDKNLTNYKVVNKRQLAFSGMQTGRDKCIRIALYNQDSPIVISPAYTVLEVSNDNVLPEYVMMWFSRKEIDRLGWFLSDASIRTNLDMDRFYEIELPLPPKETQQSIVNVYNICNERESINTELKKQIKNICPILIKGSLEEANK